MVEYADKLNDVVLLVVQDVEEWGVCDEVFDDGFKIYSKGCGGYGLGTFLVHSHFGFLRGLGETEVSCVYK